VKPESSSRSGLVAWVRSQPDQFRVFQSSSAEVAVPRLEDREPSAWGRWETAVMALPMKWNSEPRYWST